MSMRTVAAKNILYATLAVIILLAIVVAGFANCLSLEQWSYLATVVGIPLALATYMCDLRDRAAQRSIDNCIRYLDFHSQLFSDGGYLDKCVKAMEEGKFARDPTDENMEAGFRKLLSNCEKMALLHKSGGAPSSINGYMLGFFAKNIVPALNDEEKAQPYWELAIDFLKDTEIQAKKFDSMSKSERLEYFSSNHF